MDIDPVDPRDTEWETERPTYRVYFWGRSSAPLEVPPEHVGYYAREYRLHGAEDVHEVIRWANSAAAADETYTLYVECRDAAAPGLILLAGTDPTAAGPKPAPDDQAAEIPAGYLDPEQVHLDDLADALQDQSAFDLHRWLLDRNTGEVVFWNLDVGLEDPEQVDLDEADHLISIEPLPSGVWYGDMADFAERISDKHAASRLAHALRGKGAFRRFKDALYEGYPELLPAWHAFRDARARRRAVEWLWENGLVTDEAAERFYASHPDPELP